MLKLCVTDKRHALILALLTLSASHTAPADATAGFHLDRLSAPQMHLKPGESKTYRLRITNVGDETASAHVVSNPVNKYIDDPNYTIAQTGTSFCGEFETEWTELNERMVGFTTPPIAAGAHLDCSMLVTRGIDSWSDRFLYWMLRTGLNDYTNVSEAADLGTLTDITISTSSTDFGIDEDGTAHAIVQLHVKNGGGVSIAEQNAGYCEDNFLRPFITDGSGPGGCGSDEWHPYCFDWGYGFLIPEIPAGQTYTCSIRLQSIEPYAKALSFPIGVDFWQTQGDNHFWLIDTNQDDNQTLLRLEPDVPAVAEAIATPSTTFTSLILLASLIVSVACIVSRRRTALSRGGESA